MNQDGEYLITEDKMTEVYEAYLDRPRTEPDMVNEPPAL